MLYNRVPSLAAEAARLAQRAKLAVALLIPVMTKPASSVAISGESPNDALSIYFGDATLASNFVARWCAGSKTETAGGVFRVREDEPMPRVGATLHKTP